MSTPKYILVAEDDTDILSLVLAVLEDAGFRAGSTHGADTLAAVRRQKPDILLLDYQMPGMDGISVAKAIHADPETHDVPIIAMTAAGRAPLVCHEMDAMGCLGKPFDIDQLVAAVERLLHLTH
jgi:CheY-like chemotaxis protein